MPERCLEERACERCENLFSESCFRCRCSGFEPANIWRIRCTEFKWWPRVNATWRCASTSINNCISCSNDDHHEDVIVEHAEIISSELSTIATAIARHALQRPDKHIGFPDGHQKRFQWCIRKSILKWILKLKNPCFFITYITVKWNKKKLTYLVIFYAIYFVMLYEGVIWESFSLSGSIYKSFFLLFFSSPPPCSLFIFFLSWVHIQKSLEEISKLWRNFCKKKKPHISDILHRIIEMKIELNKFFNGCRANRNLTTKTETFAKEEIKLLRITYKSLIFFFDVFIKLNKTGSGNITFNKAVIIIRLLIVRLNYFFPNFFIIEHFL